MSTMAGEVRGCAPAENAYQVPNRIGCGRDEDTTVFCLCATDLCNAAARPTPLHSIMTTLFLSLLLSLILLTFPVIT